MSSPTPSDDAGATQAYSQLRDFESAYDAAQGGLRQAASLWLLAALGAIAYSLFATAGLDELRPGARLFAAAFVAFLGAAGLALLWFLDQGVYQRLLHSVFVLGLALERSNPGLPPIRTKLYADNLNVSLRLSLFYIVPVAMLAASIGLMILLRWTLTEEEHGPLLGLGVEGQRVIGGILLVLILGIIALMLNALRERDLAGRFSTGLDGSFGEYLKTGGYLDRLKGCGAAQSQTASTPGSATSSAPA